MNPNEFPVTVEEIINSTLWHGYVCVTLPGLVAPGATTWGWGASTYEAMRSACGALLANRLCDVLNNGGRMSPWVPLTDTPLLFCELSNDDGQTLCRFYK